MQGKSQLMVAPEKFILMLVKQNFPVQPTKLSLPDLPSKCKIWQKDQFIKNNLFVKKS